MIEAYCSLNYISPKTGNENPRTAEAMREFNLIRYSLTSMPFACAVLMIEQAIAPVSAPFDEVENRRYLISGLILSWHKLIHRHSQNE